MPFAEQFMIQGSFNVSTTLPQALNINCGFLPTRVELVNQTEFGVGSSAYLQSALWDYNNPTQTNVTYAASAATLFNNAVTTNGISQYDGHAASPNSYLLGSAVTGGALSKANPAQLTSTAHGLQTGDQILIRGPFTAATAMNQLGGIIFTVTVTGANTVTIPINTSGANFTATTVTTWQKVTVPPLYYPRNTVITGITAANPMVITTATNHGLTVGQQVRLRVPSALGMVQANNLTAVITAVTNTTITLGSINSTAFTAFAWPAVTSVPFTPAYVIPIGSGPTPTTFLPAVQYNFDTLEDATNNQAFQGFTIGTNILQATGTFIVAASDLITWTAWRADV